MGGTILCDVTDAREGRAAAQFASALAARLSLRVVFAGAAGDEAPAAIQRELGIDAEVRVTRGKRAEGLASLADEEGADLVIVGSRAVGLGGRNLRCRHVRELEAATSVPVLVAPPSWRKRSEQRLALAADAGSR
jgi:nucleotide-binding universal stress UspA family protein